MLAKVFEKCLEIAEIVRCDKFIESVKWKYTNFVTVLSSCLYLKDFLHILCLLELVLPQEAKDPFFR